MDKINGFEKLENSSNKLLSTILNARVGISEIKLKRKISELSERTESILKLQIKKSDILNQIEIESNRQKYLISIEQQKQKQKHKQKPLLQDKNEKDDYKEGVEKKEVDVEEDEDEEEDNDYTRSKKCDKLLESISDLKEKLFSLSTSRSEQQILLNRINQSKLIEHLLINNSSDSDSDSDNENSSNHDKENNDDGDKILKLISKRDEKVEKCLKITNIIEKNNDEILKIRKQRLEIMRNNRIIFSNLIKNLKESKLKTEQEQQNFEIYKSKTNLMGYIIQSLIYESGIDWFSDNQLVEFFDTIDDFGDHLENNKFSE